MRLASNRPFPLLIHPPRKLGSAVLKATARSNQILLGFPTLNLLDMWSTVYRRAGVVMDIEGFG